MNSCERGHIDYTMKTRYYIPSKFRVALHKHDNICEISLKNIFGKYVNNSLIKQICGYNVKDTGEGELDRIEREITGKVKEFDNKFYNYITISANKPFMDIRNRVILEHEIGFNFVMDAYEFLISPFANSKIISDDTGKHKLNGEFIFALSEHGHICLITKQELYDDKQVSVITEEDYIKQCNEYIHSKDLKVGKIYRYYKDTNRLNCCQAYFRLLYLGKFNEDAKYLDKNAINNKYSNCLVFMMVKPYNFDLTETRIKFVDFVIMSNTSKRMRREDDDQNYQVFRNQIDCQTIIDLTKAFIPIEKGYVCNGSRTFG